MLLIDCHIGSTRHMYCALFVLLEKCYIDYWKNAILVVHLHDVVLLIIQSSGIVFG